MPLTHDGRPRPAPGLGELWRAHLVPAEPERLDVGWSVRVVIAALTLGFNAAGAWFTPERIDPAEARRFLLWTLPYFGGIAALAGLHLATRKRRPLGALSLAGIGFEAAQMALSFHFAGLGNAVTLAYVILGVMLFSVFIDGRHAAAVAALASVAIVAAAVAGGEDAVTGRLYRAPAPPEARDDVAQLLAQALLLVAVVTAAGTWAGARLRWQRAALERQNRWITERILRRYLPWSLVEQLLEREGAWAAPRRAQVTIVFSDLVGFTRHAERLEVETLSRLLDRWLGAMVEVVHAHGGTIDKFMGDAIMVLFGAPLAAPPAEQAVRAVTMALRMRDVTAALAAEWRREGVEFPGLARTGIDCGEVVVGDFGGTVRSDFTAVGDHVNVAARLETACRPGAVLVSEEVWRLGAGRFVGECLGAIAVKNRDVPVTAYEVTAVVGT